MAQMMCVLIHKICFICINVNKCTPVISFTKRPLHTLNRTLFQLRIFEVFLYYVVCRFDATAGADQSPIQVQHQDQNPTAAPWEQGRPDAAEGDEEGQRAFRHLRLLLADRCKHPQTGDCGSWWTLSWMLQPLHFLLKGRSFCQNHHPLFLSQECWHGNTLALLSLTMISPQSQKGSSFNHIKNKFVKMKVHKHIFYSQILTLGMMTEHYHFFFTTLVSPACSSSGVPCIGVSCLGIHYICRLLGGSDFCGG